jgi:hypothetical protein
MSHDLEKTANERLHKTTYLHVIQYVFIYEGPSLKQYIELKIGFIVKLHIICMY